MSSFTIRSGEWTEIPEHLQVEPCGKCGKQGYPWYEQDGKIFAMMDRCDFTMSSDGTTITPHWESCATKRRCNCCGR